VIPIISIPVHGIHARFAESDFSQPVRVSTFSNVQPKPRTEQQLFISVSGHISVSGKERRKMAEYINRDAFLDQQRTWYCKDCNRRKNTKGKTVYEIGETPCRACYVGDILDDVENCPAADVVEQKTGKWFIDGNGTLRCSECKEEALLTLDTIEGVPFSTFSESYFCPNCGAKMEEDPFFDSTPMEYFESGGI